MASNLFFYCSYHMKEKVSEYLKHKMTFYLCPNKGKTHRTDRRRKCMEKKLKACRRKATWILCFNPKLLDK